MDPNDLIKRAQAAGAQFAPGPTGVRVTWPPGVDPALKAQILANKDAVKAAWLKSQQPGIAARASGAIESGLGSASRAVGKVPYVGKPAAALMPKTTPELLGQVGAGVGTAIAPEYALAEWGLPILGGVLGGAAGGKMKGQTAQGAKTGGIIGATGKVGEKLLSGGVKGAQFLARQPAAQRAASDVARLGEWIETKLPAAAKGLGVKTLRGLDVALRHKGLTTGTKNELAAVRNEVITTLNDPVINVPALQKAPANAAFLGGLGPMQAIPPPNAGVSLMKFSEAMDSITKLNKVSEYSRSDPSAPIKMAAEEARKAGWQARQQVAAELNKRTPGLGDRYLKTNRDHALAHVLSRIFKEKGMFQPNGRLNVEKFQELTQEGGAAGFRDELIMIMGRDESLKFIEDVAHRGSPPITRDIKGQGLWGMIPRMFLHTGGVSGYAHVPTGGAPIVSKFAGETPYAIPPLPANLLALLFGPAAAREAGVSEEP